MKKVRVTSLETGASANEETVSVALRTEGGPLSLAIPLETAEELLLVLRAAADDAHRMRIQRGNALRRAIVSPDRPPLTTTGCMATVAQDGRILLQFRHAAAATTSIFVPRIGAAMLAKALSDLGGVLDKHDADPQRGTASDRRGGSAS